VRFAELALVSLPFLLVLAWVLGLRHAGYRAFMVLALILAGIGAALYWFGEQRSFTGAYTPARLEHGKVVRDQPP
jgi:Na+-driven multidrug efflux pump